MRTIGVFYDQQAKTLKAAGQWSLYNNSHLLHGKPEFAAYVDAAHARLDHATARFGRLAVAWSGGKDSVVVAHLAAQHNRCTAPFIISNHLEFPDVDTYIAENILPENVVRLPHGLKWLQHNPAALWLNATNRTSGLRDKWAYQDAFARARKCGGIVYGRRSKDSKRLSADGKTGTGGGNSVGIDGQYTVKSGLARINPIHDWPTEAVYAYMRLHSLPLYPPYSYGPVAEENKLGIIRATSEGWHAWITADDATVPINAWRILRDHCDVKVLEAAAPYFILARRALSE